MSARTSTKVRALLAVLAAGFLVVGAWAQLAPRSFYDDFPGGGRHWVAADGPFNEHLVRDVGGLNLALLVVTALAALTMSRALVRVACAATLVYAIPHLAYHASHLDLYDTADKVGNVTALSVDVVLPLAILVLSLRPASPAPAPTTSP